MLFSDLFYAVVEEVHDFVIRLLDSVEEAMMETTSSIRCNSSPEPPRSQPLFHRGAFLVTSQ